MQWKCTLYIAEFWVIFFIVFKISFVEKFSYLNLKSEKWNNIKKSVIVSYHGKLLDVQSGS